MVVPVTAKVSFRRSIWFSIAPYIAWVVLYAGVGVWYLLGREPHGVFFDFLYADLFVNMLTPWILVPAIMLWIAWVGRSEIRGCRLAAGVLMMVIISAALIWGCVAILYDRGGIMLAVAVPVLLTKLNWRNMVGNDVSDSSLVILLGRGMFLPFACFAPALVISCLAVGRNTLGEHSADWLGLFGVIYFSLQAVLDYFLIRRVKKGVPAR